MRKWFLFLASQLLAGMSLVAIKSVAPELLNRQLIFFILGIGIFWAIRFVDFQLLVFVGKIAYFVNLALLVFLLSMGTVTRGITAWIPLFWGFKLQPSQFALPFFLLFFISWWPNIKKITWQVCLKLISAWVVPGILIFLEPDFGSSLIYFVSSICLFFYLPLKKKLVWSIGAIVPFLAVFAFIFLLNVDQQERITSFLTGYNQDQKSSYHARQSLIAIGSGRLFGRGLGFGVQSHLRFLPERQTDFIFASFAEETGFLGSSFIVLIYFALILFLLISAYQAKTNIFKIFLAATAMMILVQAGVNIGMNLSLLPITGITLPLFSYGGSSILTVSLMLGIAQKVLDQEDWSKSLLIA